MSDAVTEFSEAILKFLQSDQSTPLKEARKAAQNISDLVKVESPDMSGIWWGLVHDTDNLEKFICDGIAGSAAEMERYSNSIEAKQRKVAATANSVMKKIGEAAAGAAMGDVPGIVNEGALGRTGSSIMPNSADPPGDRGQLAEDARNKAKNNTTFPRYPDSGLDDETLKKYYPEYYKNTRGTGTTDGPKTYYNPGEHYGGPEKPNKTQFFEGPKISDVTRPQGQQTNVPHIPVSSEYRYYDDHTETVIHKGPNIIESGLPDPGPSDVELKGK